MRVTVAICTWNRAAILDETLEAMRPMIIPAGVEWELLVVNNDCTDTTDEVASRHASHLPVRLIHEPRKGKSNAANTAMDAASGDLILWTDDDVLVSEGWLASVVSAAARYPESAGFAGPTNPWFPTPPDPGLFAAFPQLSRGFCGLNYEGGEGVLPEGAQVVGANMAFRRAAVAGLRFDPNLGTAPRPIGRSNRRVTLALGAGEEDEYVRQLRARGGQITWIPSMEVRHYVDPRRMTLDYLRTLYVELGRVSVRVGGVPEGANFLGVPRWIVRKWVNAGMASTYHGLFGSRVAALEQIRHRAYFRGIIEESWAFGRARAKTGGTGASVINGTPRSIQEATVR